MCRLQVSFKKGRGDYSLYFPINVQYCGYKLFNQTNFLLLNVNETAVLQNNTVLIIHAKTTYQATLKRR